MRADEAGTRATPVRRRGTFPWLPCLLLLASIYLFWGLPRQLGDRPVQVEFEPPVAAPQSAPTRTNGTPSP